MECELKYLDNLWTDPDPGMNSARPRDPDGPILLQSICANCSIQLSTKDFVASYNLPYEKHKRSVHQGLELIFKCHEVEDPRPNALKFCSTCGTIFGRLLNLYMQFLRATFVGSYVHNIALGPKKETNNDSLNDMFHESENLSSTIHGGPSINQNTKIRNRKLQKPVPCTKQGTPSQQRHVQEHRVTRRSSRVRSKITADSTIAPMTQRTRPIVRRDRTYGLTSAKGHTKGQPSVMCTRINGGKKDKNTEDFDIGSPSLRSDGHMKEFEIDPLQEPDDTFTRNDSSYPPSPTSVNYAVKPLIPVLGAEPVPSDLTVLEPCSQGVPIPSDRTTPEQRTHAVPTDTSVPEPCTQAVPCATIMLERLGLKQQHDFPFPCGHCDRTFRLHATRRFHIRTVHEGHKKRRQAFVPVEMSPELESLLRMSTYKCASTPACVSGAFQFDNFKDWVTHQEINHSIQTGYDLTKGTQELIPKCGLIRPCSQCGQTSKSTTDMKKHLNSIHLKLRPFSCHICKKAFSQKTALEGHKKSVHGQSDTPEEQFLCTFCGSMKGHELTHLGERVMKYECDICPIPVKFISLSKLNEHKASAHPTTTESPLFICEDCGVTFRRQGLLTKHRTRQHLNSGRSENCTLCEKGFKSKQHLKEHLKGVHKLTNEGAIQLAKINIKSIFRILPNGDRVYPTKTMKPKTCDICGRTYVRREQLFSHYVTVHGKTEIEAKEITGLESKRNLIPSGRESKRKKSESVKA